MENNNEIEISIIKGDKLFNENTPFVINLSCTELIEENKKINADLICVIDVSGSMQGEKIRYVKESLKIVLKLMDDKDRICLILFENLAKNYFDLNYLTKQNKEILIDKINKISTGGGTNIMSGLELAVNIIKEQCNNNNTATTILLLSDGCDNYLNDVQIADSLKNITKGLGLSFTLNTFGYGDNHDAKIMNKLANIRDGSFFYVDDYSKISEYFVAVLGGCLSVISQKVDLNLQILNNNCKISRILGEDNLYDYRSNSKSFKTSMLQFIWGKDYTFVLEILVNDAEVKIDEELFKVEINYEDITQNKNVKKEKIYKYHLKDLCYSKANEEYIRAHVYSNIDTAIKLKDQNQIEKGKELLENSEKWLLKNYKGNNKDYINDIEKAKGLFSNDSYLRMTSYKISTSIIHEKLFKTLGRTMSGLNSKQINLVKSISNKIPHKKEFYFNDSNKNQMAQNNKNFMNPIYNQIGEKNYMPNNKNYNVFKQFNLNKRDNMKKRFGGKSKNEIQRINSMKRINTKNTSHNKIKNGIQPINNEKKTNIDNMPKKRINTAFVRKKSRSIYGINHATGNYPFNQFRKEPRNNIKNNNYKQTGKINDYEKERGKRKDYFSNQKI